MAAWGCYFNVTFADAQKLINVELNYIYLASATINFTSLPVMTHDEDVAAKLKYVPRETFRLSGSERLGTFMKETSIRRTSLSYCWARISCGNLSNATAQANADCRSTVAVRAFAENGSQAPAPPGADLPGAFASRPSFGTPCRKDRTETACNRCAYAYA